MIEFSELLQYIINEYAHIIPGSTHNFNDEKKRCELPINKNYEHIWF